MTGLIIAETRFGRAARLALVALFALAVALPGLTQLPPLDRDEARFAQATAQMLESGDFITIRFQEAERNKKPVGVHWLQAASVSLFSEVEARQIWPYRLPSVAGVVLAAMFTYLAGARLYGPATGLLAAVLLAAAPVVIGEATIAKTDAMLLAAICAAQCAFIHIFAAMRNSQRPAWGWPLLFWTALGAGILLKGPIAPMVVALTGAAMVWRWPRLTWISAFRPAAGVLILLAIAGPWAVAIGLATEGRFFIEAIGGDMLGKIGQVQESHGGPPGYHLGLVWILFWPAAALLIPAAAYAIAARRTWRAWFLAAWIVPGWLVFELTATKLPHYAMPFYPALAILAARAASLGEATRRKTVRLFGAGVHLGVGLIASGLVLVLPAIFGAPEAQALCIACAAAILVGALASAWLFLRGRAAAGAWTAACLSLLLSVIVLNSVLPGLDQLRVSPRLSAAVEATGRHALKDGAPPTAVAGYYEPSAVFLLGTRTVLTDGAGAARHLAAHPDAAAAVEAGMEQDFLAALDQAGITVRSLAVIDGLNYSNGRRVRLTVYAQP